MDDDRERVDPEAVGRAEDMDFEAEVIVFLSDCRSALREIRDALVPRTEGGCPKCESPNLRKQHHPGERPCGDGACYRWMEEDKPARFQKEHLLTTCQECGHQWIEAVPGDGDE